MKRVVIPNSILLPEVARMVSEEEYVKLRVKGNSMLPFILGDRDSVILVQSSEYKVRDIVFAEITKDQFVLHRIINITGDTVTLMGDGNISGTELCNISDIKAKVTYIIRDGKKIDCNGVLVRLFVIIWRKFLPIRRHLLMSYWRVKRVKQKVKRVLKKD